MTAAMTMTPILRRRLLLSVGLIFALWASWKVGHEEVAETPVAARTAAPSRRAGSKPPVVAPVLSLDWPARVDQRQPVTDLFNLPSSAPTPPAVVLVAPPLPELKLKYIGRLEGSDNKHVFLADALDQVTTAAVGQTVADGWQLAAMDSQKLVFQYTATGHKQTMLIGTSQ